ncbi:MAG: protein-L-isoaspartate(D-aspartate) O-methyltransferase [Candidatus Schekmanbacteria bacterium]|nr:protein-L-isoaspartate(D-aspartate) O-methyltransferase [Candidatus Schekmanbacteria bacterium]
MVEDQLIRRGIKDPQVLQAMRKVPRHLFVPPKYALASYNDSPLPIGDGQTISQPYIVAYMTEALKLEKADRILEIGTGSGYQAAVLGEIAGQVYSVEIICSLARQAEAVLKNEGYKNIEVRCADGFLGWPEYAPYDAIIVTAAPEEIPQALKEQLKIGGRMIIPIGRIEFFQELVLVTRTGQDSWHEEMLLPVRFVPMTGGEK